MLFRRDDPEPEIPRLSGGEVQLETGRVTMHTWQLDPMRTRMDIGVIVWRCAHCGCLQIKNDGLNSSSVYKPNTPGWNPFRTLNEEPPCQSKPRRSINVLDPEPTEAR